jgi:hypothetical protein
MSRIRLYFDEDAMQNALVVALRARHIDVLTASDCGMVGRSEPQDGDGDGLPSRVPFCLGPLIAPISRHRF